MKSQILGLLTLLILMGFISSVNAQDDSPAKKDTLIKGNGERIYCVIKTFENDKVQYITGGRFLTTTYTQRLSEIKFSDGTSQFFQPLFKINSEDDWQKIKVTSDQSKVKNLLELGVIDAEQTGSVFAKQDKLKSLALERIRKEAAKLGSHIVLILDSNNSDGGIILDGDRIVGFRSGSKITAKAYGF